MGIQKILASVDRGDEVVVGITIPARFRQLQRAVDQVAAHRSVVVTRLQMHRYMTHGVTDRGFQPDLVIEHFVYIHTSRTAGTFLNKLILEHVLGARLLQYHGHLKDLPEEFAHLPIIGFVRNPWDWYVFMYCDYRRKKQYVYQMLSDRGTLGFKATISRFLKLGDNSVQSKRLLEQLGRLAPTVINDRAPPRLRNPGLRSVHFKDFSEDQGYYSWLFKLMYETKREHRIHIGRFENLREEALQLFEQTGTPITQSITAYLKGAVALNSSPRPENFIGGYPPELEQLVADKDRYLIQ